MKNEKDMIKWLNNLKSDIGQPQHSQLWHYAEILDVIAKYLESTERTGEWAVAYLDHESVGVRPRTLYCSECNWLTSFPSAWCPNCGAKMNKGGDTE